MSRLFFNFIYDLMDSLSNLYTDHVYFIEIQIIVFWIDYVSNFISDLYDYCKKPHSRVYINNFRDLNLGTSFIRPPIFLQSPTKFMVLHNFFFFYHKNTDMLTLYLNISHKKLAVFQTHNYLYFLYELSCSFKREFTFQK